jgi:chromosome segregation ATPase
MIDFDYFTGLHGIIASLLFLIAIFAWQTSNKEDTRLNRLVSLVFFIGFIFIIRQLSLSQNSPELRWAYNIGLVVVSFLIAAVSLNAYRKSRAERLLTLKEIVNINLENPLKNEINREVIRPEIQRLESLRKESGQKEKQLAKIREILDEREDKLNDLKEELEEKREALEKEQKEFEQTKANHQKEKNGINELESRLNNEREDINKRLIAIEENESKLKDEKKMFDSIKRNFSGKEKEYQMIGLNKINLEDEKRRLDVLKEELKAKERLMLNKEEKLIDWEYDLRIKEKRQNAG